MCLAKVVVRCCRYTWLVASPLTELHVTLLVVVEEEEFLLKLIREIRVTIAANLFCRCRAKSVSFQC